MLTKLARTAQQLAGEFLKNGNFEGLGAPLDFRTVALILPASAEDGINIGEYGLSGLSVQSVGYASGTDDDAVYVYVTRGSKAALARLSGERDGVNIRVVNFGKLVIRPEATVAVSTQGHIFEHNARIACGSSCAPAGENYSGTFGALVISNGELMALSNNHVFAACNHVAVGQPILSPSALDARPGVPAPRELCRHSKIAELRSGTPDLVPPMRLDAAVAAVPDDGLVSSWQGDEYNGYDTPTQVVDPFAGLRVKKFGRTSGLTHGVVESYLSTLMSLHYKNRHFSSRVWFTDIWLVKADQSGQFALPGDSGSLVVTDDGIGAVGLLFACSSKGEYGFIAPISTVLSELGVTLLNWHGI